jgi:NAD(P)H-nitrite reductase large subunit
MIAYFLRWRKLRAGTICGSCLPELKRMLVHERIQ